MEITLSPRQARSAAVATAVRAVRFKKGSNVGINLLDEEGKVVAVTRKSGGEKYGFVDVKYHVSNADNTLAQVESEVTTRGYGDFCRKHTTRNPSNFDGVCWHLLRSLPVEDLA